jgi:hypothetical protein
MKTTITVLVLVAACSGGTPGPGGGDDTTPDANHSGGGDDAPTGGIPDTITLSGTAVDQGQTSSTPLAGVSIGAFTVSDDTTAVATAMTDAQGKYSLTVPTHGAPVDGYLKATKSGEVDTYLYPPYTMTADFAAADVNMVTTSNYSTLRSFEGGTAGKGLVIALVVDAGGQPVGGATVSSTPASAKYVYMDANGNPFSTTATAADGISFMIDAPPTGTVTVSASKAGATFKSHDIKARADKLTTTLISE